LAARPGVPSMLSVRAKYFQAECSRATGSRTCGAKPQATRRRAAQRAARRRVPREASSGVSVCECVRVCVCALASARRCGAVAEPTRNQPVCHLRQKARAGVLHHQPAREGARLGGQCSHAQPDVGLQQGAQVQQVPRAEAPGAGFEVSPQEVTERMPALALAGRGPVATALAVESADEGCAAGLLDMLEVDVCVQRVAEDAGVCARLRERQATPTGVTPVAAPPAVHSERVALLKEPRPHRRVHSCELARQCRVLVGEPCARWLRVWLGGRG
jgi:hypothetical protein